MKRCVEWIAVVLILTILGMGCPQELNDLLPEDTGSLSLVQLQYNPNRSGGSSRIISR